MNDSWGTQVTDEQASKEDVAAEATADSEPATPAAVEEDNSKTFEEYLEELKLQSADLGPKPTIRKPNEGEDPSSWGVVAPAKDEISEADPYLKVKPSQTKTKTKKEKTVVEFEPQFAPIRDSSSAPRRGGRGGPRGGPRGGQRGGRGGRGGPRGGRSSAPAPAASTAASRVSLSNLSEFPSLS